MMRALSRLILVPLGFALALAAAAAVAMSLGLAKISDAVGGARDGAQTVEAYWEIMRAGSMLLAGLSILPALLAVVIGEVARIRSWLYYMVAGGLAFAALPLLIRAGSAAPMSEVPAALWQVLATAGFAGGLVYWAIAGRGS